MEIICKQISISDDDLGCQIMFSEKEMPGEELEHMSFEEIINCTGRYLLLQRSYSELDFGDDNYYFETHDENLTGELAAFEIVMSRQFFELQFDSETIKVLINPTDTEFAELKRVLPTIINKRGRLTINE